MTISKLDDYQGSWKIFKGNRQGEDVVVTRLDAERYQIAGLGFSEILDYDATAFTLKSDLVSLSLWKRDDQVLVGAEERTPGQVEVWAAERVSGIAGEDRPRSPEPPVWRPGELWRVRFHRHSGGHRWRDTEIRLEKTGEETFDLVHPASQTRDPLTYSPYERTLSNDQRCLSLWRRASGPNVIFSHLDAPRGAGGLFPFEEQIIAIEGGSEEDRDVAVWGADDG